MAPLTGAELLTLVESSEHKKKADLVREAGYVTEKADGKEAVNYSAFYDAILEAKGVNLKFSSGGNGGNPGRKLSNVGSVQKNGNFIVGNAYIKKAGIEPGAKYSIEIDDEKVITLIPA
jgi:AbrB-like transcriptional regulator